MCLTDLTWAPVTGEDTAGRCAAYNGTAGHGAGCYFNSTAGCDAAWRLLQRAYGAVRCRAVYNGTAEPSTGDDKAGRRAVYNGTTERRATYNETAW